MPVTTIDQELDLFDELGAAGAVDPSTGAGELAVPVVNIAGLLAASVSANTARDANRSAISVRHLGVVSRCWRGPEMR